MATAAKQAGDSAPPPMPDFSSTSPINQAIQDLKASRRAARTPLLLPAAVCIVPVR